jgi:hypothetical protein
MLRFGLPNGLSLGRSVKVELPITVFRVAGPGAGARKRYTRRPVTVTIGPVKLVRVLRLCQKN